ncbi:MAG: S8 family peptidase [Ignavibacteria bacterium]|nr:S8 family peptidase [Ignavibacteria bacterium]
MRNLLIYSAALLLSIGICSAVTYNKKYSIDTYFFLSDVELLSQDTKVPKMNNYFLAESETGVPYTKVYIQFTPAYDEQALEAICATVSLKLETVAILEIPVANIEALAGLPFIERIEVAKPLLPELDRAIVSSNVDKVHTGMELQRSYYGEGVIVGVIDYGFDFTHPMFIDSNGNSRVKRAWITARSGGTPPATSTIGSLYTDSNYIMNTIKYSSNTNAHGTHVLGIAAGTEVTAAKSTYSGVASKADIAVVDFGGAYSSTGTQLAEALKYLFNYADSANKPIAVNASLGYPNTMNASDGLGLADVAIKQVIAKHPKGKVFINSAGNEGSNRSHFALTLHGDSAYSKTAMSYAAYNYKMSNLSFWGDPLTDFNIDFYVTDGTSRITAKLITLNTNIEKSVSGSTITLQFGTSSKQYVITYSVSPYFSTNEKPNLHIQVLGPSSSRADTLYFVIKSDSTSLHCWENNGIAHRSYSSNITPDANYTISSPGPLEEVITVGAYVTRANGVYGNHGYLNNIATFSSKGPTTDGRIKPDIAAPGSELISAKNTFTTELDQYIVDSSAKDGKFKFIAISGTSMSAPMTTGIVALMLEVNPNLTLTEIKDILKVTAINDENTGEVKNNKSTTWGWGKIDAYAIMQDLEVKGIDDESNFQFAVYPNPATNLVNVKVDNVYDIPYMLDIYDESGKLVYLTSLMSEKQIDLSSLQSGVYFVRLNNGKDNSIQKIVKK